jgi:hypothetical protein
MPTPKLYETPNAAILTYIIQVKQKNAAYLGGLNSSPTLRQSLLAVTYTMQIEAHSPNETSHLHWH